MQIIGQVTLAGSGSGSSIVSCKHRFIRVKRVVARRHKEQLVTAAQHDEEASEAHLFVAPAATLACLRTHAHTFGRLSPFTERS